MHEVSIEGRFVGMEPNGAGWRICLMAATPTDAVTLRIDR